MLDRDELPGYRIVNLSRVSNTSKDSDSSLNRQDGQLYDEYQALDEKYDAEIVETYRQRESGSSMDRESLDDILELAKQDEFDILMVWAIHRLTRADPWETVEYLLELKRQGIIIYSDRDGYFDWEDPDDANRMMDRVSTSREWRNEIVRGSNAGCRDILKDGHWPYGELAYGLADREDEGIVVKDDYRWIPEAVLKAFIETQDLSKVKESIKNAIENRSLDIEPPTESQIETILSNELFVGNLVLRETGELILEKEDLLVVDPELYTRVQEILQQSASGKDEAFGAQDLPDFVYELITRFGQEYVVENVSAIRWCCPKCHSVDINISDTTIEYWNISLPKIYCNKPNCGYNGPAIRLKELNNIDSTLPMVCPVCQRTGDFEIEPITLGDSSKELHKFTCGKCGDWMVKDTSPDPHRRAFDDPNALDLRGDDSTLTGQPETANTDTYEEGHLPVGSGRARKVTEEDVFDALESWLQDHGPQKESAQSIILNAAELLNDEGPLSRAELKKRLFSDHTDIYASPLSLWEATIARFYTDTPGFKKQCRGNYDFDAERIKYLLGWSAVDTDR